MLGIQLMAPGVKLYLKQIYFLLKFFVCQGQPTDKRVNLEVFRIERRGVGRESLCMHSLQVFNLNLIQLYFLFQFLNLQLCACSPIFQTLRVAFKAGDCVDFEVEIEVALICCVLHVFYKTFVAQSEGFIHSLHLLNLNFIQPYCLFQFLNLQLFLCHMIFQILCVTFKACGCVAKSLNLEIFGNNITIPGCNLISRCCNITIPCCNLMLLYCDFVERYRLPPSGFRVLNFEIFQV
mmetsp:Transcript_5141/g.8253  ORF Transcript_5141/g.8253 Transcript_5141/m.8253 type:complete len:236 (-) Transcript_5141:51-758(-)